MIKFGVALQKVFQVAACCKVNLPRRGLDARNMRMVLGVSPIFSTHTQPYEPNCASRSSRVRQLEHALKGSNPLGDSKPNNENLRHFVCLKLKLEAPRFSRAHFFLKNLREDPVFTKESVRKKKKKIGRISFVKKLTRELTSIRRWVVSHATI